MKTEICHIRIRLIGMSFLQFAVWGAYLISMGTYLFHAGMGDKIGYFYAMQGMVALFMPALMGIVADRWIQAQKLLAGCHLLSALFKVGMGIVAMSATASANFPLLMLLYTLSIAFFMPTLALANSVSYTALESVKLDPVSAFPSIRLFGTVGFIGAMLLTDVLGFQASPNQFFLSAALGLVAAGYACTLPACPVSARKESKSLTEALGLKAFALFKRREMALFFLFSVLMGVALQITNGFANPFLNSFAKIPEYADTFGVRHANALISLSQLSETFCLLLIPFALKRLGIKRVMLIAMLCWAARFALFGWGNPGSGVWMFILSMIVYGVAFDFFNISGSLFVNKETGQSIRSSAQGLFMMMTNGIGATIGTILAQQVVNHYVDFSSDLPQVEGWSKAWLVFAGYMLGVALLFALLFKYKHNNKK
ncbi:MAG: MFS transporter [Bacteroidaceae bacterium]|nr:MFS transporter [Bacteroidaceae bacterium]